MLAAAEGLENKAIVERVGADANTVGRWRQRFAERRLDGLYDEPRSGAPRKIGDENIAEIIGALWSASVLVGTMSGVLDVVLALAGLDGVDEASEMTACVVDASFLGAAHPVLDLGEGLLDGVEVR